MELKVSTLQSVPGLSGLASPTLTLRAHSGVSLFSIINSGMVQRDPSESLLAVPRVFEALYQELKTKTK